MHMDEVMADVNRSGKGLERAPYEVEGETRGMSEIQRERNRYYGVGMLNSPDPAAEGRTLSWEMVNSVYPWLSRQCTVLCTEEASQEGGERKQKRWR